MGKFKDSAIAFFKKIVVKPRLIGGVVIVLIVLWALYVFFGSSNEPAPSASNGQPADTHVATASPSKSSSPGGTSNAATGSNCPKDDPAASRGAAGIHEDAPDGPSAQGTNVHAAPATLKPAPAKIEQAPADRHPIPATANTQLSHKPTPRGVAFVEATIRPMEYELRERWWGWRPNDIINLTDNVNNFQLGVLEITRRTVVALAERISRHGVTDALDPNLEEAMNWFMVKASSYWFPSAESKYKDGLEELRAYLENLQEGKATFFIRTDNLIPLLASFEDLLGSCDENLVKDTNEDGTPVGLFKADNYFYYTQGVASSMAEVLEAVHHDFLLTLESRNATELLHHAVVSLKRAADMRPFFILDSELDSIFANHRANMAAPISHARFYLGQLVKTLST